MEPEYRRLPIPHWLEVHCPRCGYDLRGLPEHRCPECGQPFDIDDLITPFTPLRPPRITCATRPVPEIGLACGRCDEFLDGAAGDTCPHCGATFRLEDYIPEGRWVSVSGGESETEKDLIAIRLRQDGIPCIRSGDPLRGVVGVRTAGTGAGGDVRVPREYFFDALEVINARPDPDQPGWQCRRCGQEVPGTFEICWNCRSPRSHR